MTRQRIAFECRNFEQPASVMMVRWKHETSWEPHIIAAAERESCDWDGTVIRPYDRRSVN